MATLPAKVCTGCGLGLEIDQFRRGNGRYGRDAKCKACKTERQPVEPPETPDATPARALRLQLREARARGEPFDIAWERARMNVVGIDSSWSQVIAWSQPEWRSAYERQGAPAVQPSALKPDHAT